jgi:Asp-tRNA(Asn)/Glu-tRNA(Gln) amidotransferase C subunit
MTTIKAGGVSTGRGRNNPLLEVTDLLIYILWRDVLNRCQDDELSPISTLPFLPVIAGEHRILMTSSVAPHLLSTASFTSTQDGERAQLRREAGRLKALVDQDIQMLVGRENPPSLENQFLEDFGRGRFEPQTAHLAAFPQENLAHPLQDEIPAIVTQSTENDDSGQFDTFSSRVLGEALKTLRMPMIDGGIFEEMPAIISSARGTGNRATGHKILQCLSFIESEHLVLHIADSGGELIESGPLLRFDLLTEQHRKSVLLEILAAHRQRRLQDAEIAQLKILPLFTSIEGTMITIASCSGIYWCDSTSALTSLSNAYSRETPSDNPSDIPIPTVLISDPELRELYTLVGAEELTPLTVVKKFTLPSLDRMEGLDRLRVMTDLASQWELYRRDAQLLQLLKVVAFVPSYSDIDEFTESKEPETHPFDLSRPLRKPDQLFSWTNRDLLTALAGSQQNEYFAPPSLRTPAWHNMMVDLGMPLELDKESLMRSGDEINATLICLGLQLISRRQRINIVLTRMKMRWLW